MPKNLPRIIKNRGYYLRIFRAERNISQAEAAEFFGLTPSAWSLLEDGKRNASPAVAIKIAQHTGADLYELLGVKK